MNGIGGRSDSEQAEKGRKLTGGVRRSAIREGLRDFAKAVAWAEDCAAVVDVLARMDEYVDRVLETG